MTEFNTAQAAIYLNISVSYLRNMRCQGVGPRYYKKPGRGGPNCYYSKGELDAWATSHSFRRDKKSEVDLLKEEINRLQAEIKRTQAMIAHPRFFIGVG